ncbi:MULTISPECIES: MaoC/PaaZ C-terminal domain-containing protein [Streptomyces]|uniref:MaoC/PaaZ C-terminal domain-containing protein n=1 Tax=Streptomyces TaxID=1883 RepID=UPI00163C76E3|nr:MULTISPECIES: MaoC/PaaZ C-terminal domain-containing protein [Streptomyces]MBC2878381.1 MaoC family dehydratase N-terminal domain-containing protein [Streptomyces sp. TYQ1024]UBI40503.1 3-alpha,7-alpha,12-alpha-trihydroxy-5-beta-cholest-24-enoyl-CoA hydratase [Streptomyces mobaraensis]UKW33085.1 MaoC family dehydratase N-terminal domain-containing protein [Streptomyces sp. TYQ1024]
MSLHRHLVGHTWALGPLRWTFADTALYALGVGAGAGDPSREREFTTENSTGVTPSVLPTFATTLVPPGEHPALGDFDVTRLLHSHQSLTLHGPLPVEGAAVAESRLTGLYDRGRAALAVIDSRCTDTATGRPLADLRTGLTVRHAGGFGGETAEDEPWERPAREPDHTAGYRTAPHQALLYRLCGDRNPLHSDPAVAARLGLPRPPLHGLCTFGFAGRALLRALCGGDPARFGTMSAAFTAPVLPGRDLIVRIWETGGATLFEVRSHGRVVLGRGRFVLRPV